MTRIEEYRGTPVVDKYLWRIRAFNYTCQSISENLNKIDLLADNGIAPSEELKNRIVSLKINYV